MPAAATQQDYETIGVETVDRICTITMNRPDVYNALNDKLTFELQDALKGGARDKGVSVVVLTGTGIPTRSPGARPSASRSRANWFERRSTSP